jgi:hypothetical protein
MLKVTGMKSMEIGGSFTFGEKWWVRGGKLSNDIHLGVDLTSEGCKLGREVLFHGFHFCVYRGMNILIDGDNIGTKFPHFLLGLCEIIGKGIEVDFKVLAMGVGHDEGGKRKGTDGTTKKELWVKGITMIRATRGIQWCKSQIRGLEGVWFHEKKIAEK